MAALLGEHEYVFRHGHMACGIGSGAAGLNMANPRVRNLVGRFECAGGIDVDPGAIANFEMMTGVRGTVMDLFDRELYEAFHGKAPPSEFREAIPEDIRAVFGRLDVLFASYPCKGYSGLLSSAASETDKYQALNLRPSSPAICGWARARTPSLTPAFPASHASTTSSASCRSMLRRQRWPAPAVPQAASPLPTLAPMPGRTVISRPSTRSPPTTSRPVR